MERPTRVFGFGASSHWAAHCDCCHDGVGSVIAAFLFYKGRQKTRFDLNYFYLDIINILTKF